MPKQKRGTGKVEFQNEAAETNVLAEQIYDAAMAQMDFVTQEVDYIKFKEVGKRDSPNELLIGSFELRLKNGDSLTINTDGGETMLITFEVARRRPSFQEALESGPQ